MFTRNKELWYALAAVVVVTGGYFAFTSVVGTMPPAAHLFGHGIGVLGFVLMLMTETLYTLRKRAKSARWGRVSWWLKFHIFTGLVGSYMVLLHPAMHFRGVAAVLSLFTVVVVASGVVGRYLYTRVPRVVEIVGQATAPAAGAGPSGAAPGLLLQAPAVVPAVARSDSPGALRFSPPAAPERAAAAAVAAEYRVPGARKGLATWRALHVPLTFLLFAIAVVHIVGAIYYATLLH
jgi:hypothetical protein